MQLAFCISDVSVMDKWPLICLEIIEKRGLYNSALAWESSHMKVFVSIKTDEPFGFPNGTFNVIFQPK